jgi:phosphoglycerol transferase
MIQPISSFVKSEWYIFLPLAIFSFVAASLLMSGYPQGLLPELSVAFTYAGDGMGYLWNVQRAIEGAWYFENARSGFPFGSNHLDYPTSDTGTYLALKILGWIFTTPIATTNVYYLLGFSLCAIAAYLVARTFSVSKHFSITTALIYSFSAFHFGRLGHLFFTWYFVAPIFFYFGFRLFSNHLIFTNPRLGLKTKLWNSLALIALASFGIYYSLFGCFVLALSTIIASAFQRSWRYLQEGIVTIAFVILGVLLNVMPSLSYIFNAGENREGINRLASESELYALKITQLLLPRADHRLNSFFEFASQYNSSFPLVTENMSASLGFIGSLGFLLLISLSVLLPFYAVSVKPTHGYAQAVSLQFRLRLLAALALGMVLMGTLGGFSSLFAMLISTSIRSWNRISIFIAFISVLTLMLCVDCMVTKYLRPSYSKLIGITLAMITVVVGIYDQTVKPCHACHHANKTLIDNDATFIHSIESILPPRAAIYQLPYMAYPEFGSVNGMGSYDQARGLLHSSQLKWSFGGMRGRTGDWFFRKLALLPMSQQIPIIKAIGFSGIYIDRRGYLGLDVDKRCAPFALSKTDRIKNDCLTATELEQDIIDVLGTKFSHRKMVSKDEHLSFTPIRDLESPASAANIEATTKATDYLNAIGFKLDNGMPIQTAGGFEEPLDFRKSNLDFPHYVGNVTGLSGLTIVNGIAEGRWSDAMTAKYVTIWLAKPLPMKFNLQIYAKAAGPNVGKPLKVRIGRQVKEIFPIDEFSPQSLAFETTKPVYKIEFMPAEPFSPARRWGASDTRFLAVNFQQVTISPY